MASTQSDKPEPASPRRIASSLLLWAPPIILFIFLGALIAPMFGLEYDELLFARGLLVPQGIVFSVPHHPDIPIMIMSYVGALKSWLYAPIFGFFGMSTWSVRLPVVLLAAATLYLLARLARKIVGWPAALFVLWLLSTDIVFIFTATFDWGPVVLQNLLLVLGLGCVETWQRHPRQLVLFLAGLAFGLALWDKALFVWNLSAMGVVFAGLCFRHLRSLLTRRIAGIFVMGLFVGAFPLILYNFSYRNQTLHDGAHFSTAEVADKFQYLKFSIDGQTAIAPFLETDHSRPDRAARPFREISTQLARKLPAGLSSWRLPFYAALVPLGLIFGDARRRRWIVFFAGSAIFAWLESALTINAGATIHHSVLIWPLLYSAAGLSAGIIATRFRRFGILVIALVVTILSLRGLAQADLLYSNLIAYSPAVQFTNADVPLAAWLERRGVKTVITTDWGLDNPVRVRTGNHVAVLDEAFALQLHQFDENNFAACRPPACVLVGHPRARELFAGNDAGLEGALAAAGLQRTLIGQLDDSHGMPSVQIYSVGASLSAGAQ